MKKTLVVLGLLLSVNCFGMTIDTIEIVQAQDFNAEWNSGTGVLEWKPALDGTGAELQASATLRRSDGAEFVVDVLVHAIFSAATDTSSNGWASASFATVGDWDMTFSDAGVYVGKIEGTGILGNTYDEVEGVEVIPGININPDNLYGGAVVEVTESDFTAYFGGAGWKDENGGEAKMESWMVLPTGTNFSSYSEDYSTNLTTLWLNADENTIPEPATLVILGLGSLLAIRRRRA